MSAAPAPRPPAHQTRPHAGEPSVANGVAIAPFAPADLGEVMALWRDSEGIGMLGDTPESIAACVARSPGMSFVARDVDGTLVGAVLGTHDGRRGYLHHLAVAPGHRRRGIGRALALRVAGAVERLGFARCHLFVQRGNDDAVAFWTRIGWVERTDVVMMSRTFTEARA